MPNLVDLGETLGPDLCKRVKKGQALKLRQEDGSIHSYKVLRINKAKKTVWAEKMELINGDEWEGMNPDQRKDYLMKGRK